MGIGGRPQNDTIRGIVTPALNFKRGFNRLFLVLCFGWVVYCTIFYPLHELGKAETGLRGAIQQCVNDNSTEHITLNECVQLEQTLWNPNQYALKNFYHDVWPELLAAILVVPVVIYGVVRGLAAVSMWVWRGYKPNPKTT
jgi:hypothetical protein